MYFKNVTFTYFDCLRGELGASDGERFLEGRELPVRVELHAVFPEVLDVLQPLVDDPRQDMGGQAEHTFIVVGESLVLQLALIPHVDRPEVGIPQQLGEGGRVAGHGTEVAVHQEVLAEGKQPLPVVGILPLKEKCKLIPLKMSI